MALANEIIKQITTIQQIRSGHSVNSAKWYVYALLNKN